MYKSWFVSGLSSMGNIYSILGWYQRILVSDFNHQHLFPVLWIVSWGFALTWHFLPTTIPNPAVVCLFWLGIFCRSYAPLVFGNQLLTDFKKMWDPMEESFTHWSSVVPHKGSALTFQFFSCFRIPRHRISSCLVGTPPRNLLLT